MEPASWFCRDEGSVTFHPRFSKKVHNRAWPVVLPPHGPEMRGEKSVWQFTHNLRLFIQSNLNWIWIFRMCEKRCYVMKLSRLIRNVCCYFSGFGLSMSIFWEFCSHHKVQCVPTLRKKSMSFIFITFHQNCHVSWFTFLHNLINKRLQLYC